MTTGQKISALRKQKGYSQEALAEKSGLSLRTIQRLEQDESAPRPHTLKTIADCLAIHVAELTNPEPQLPEPTSDLVVTRLRLINTSCLLALLLPVVYVIVPIILWFRHRHHPAINAVGRRIVSFQILWLAGCFLVLLLSPLVYYQLTGARMIGQTSPVLISYVVMLVLNTAVVVREAIRLQHGQLSVYAFVPLLF